MLAFVLIKIYIFIRFNVDDENVEPAFVLSREEQNNNEPSDPEQEETSSVRACLWPLQRILKLARLPNNALPDSTNALD